MATTQLTEARARPHQRSKLSSLPGVTSLPTGVSGAGQIEPRPPPKRDIPQPIPSGPVDLSNILQPPSTADLMPPVQTSAAASLDDIDSRLAVNEKTSRALVAEVVRLQNTLDTALRGANEDRAARREAETRLRAASDAVGQLASRLERLERRRAADDEVNSALMEQLRNSEAASLAARTEINRRQEDQAARLAEIHDVISDLREQIDSEERQRNDVERNILQRLAALQQTVDKQSTVGDPLRELEARLSTERNNAAEAERVLWRERIAEIDANIGRKVNQVKGEIRETIEPRLTKLEETRGGGTNVELDSTELREIREQVESRLDSFYKLNEAESLAIRDLIAINKKKTNKNLHRLNDAVNLLDKQLEEQKKANDKLIAAEILSRKHHEQAWENKMADIQADMKRLVDNQLALLNDVIDKRAQLLKDDLHNEINEMKTNNTTAINDLKASIGASAEQGMKELSAIRAKQRHTEEDLKACVEAVAAESSKKDSELFDKVAVLERKDNVLEAWKTKLSATVDGLEKELARIKAELLKKSPSSDEGLKEEIKAREALATDHAAQLEELRTQLKDETRKRTKEIESLKKLRPPPPPPAADGSQPEASSDGWQAEAYDLQLKVKKVTETVQVVKTLLAMKIETEKRLRTTDIEEIQTQIDELREHINNLGAPADDEGQGDNANNDNQP